MQIVKKKNYFDIKANNYNIKNTELIFKKKIFVFNFKDSFKNVLDIVKSIIKLCSLFTNKKISISEETKPDKPFSLSVRYSQIRLSIGREYASHFTIFSVPYKFICAKSWYCTDDSQKDWDLNHPLHSLHQNRTEEIAEGSLVL